MRGRGRARARSRCRARNIARVVIRGEPLLFKGGDFSLTDVSPVRSD
jgi:uncharacterized protein with PIN domain